MNSIFLFCFETPRYTDPHSSSLSMADFRFYLQHDLASKRGPNLGRPFDLTFTLVRGSKLESAYEVLDFEFVGIPDSTSRCVNFHLFLKLTIAFCFQCSKNSSLDWM
ncbi:hypothetical protein AVEN_183701-1 [Araneus ventricosus]|uniref:Uncharacterized protein n=1 Tax=Araneus ventricosus TaxID=182803 RepID=A0A4Y2W8C3_ARAVE|nr:hypothetical protein AVEN_239439-1 [Araneus ventricosus]GBO33432.1 hypothetical protein AVEN_183701-1 [Araneus ventricosus]